jgi:hypothetical protein
MHQIEFDVNEHRNGSIDVRFTWTHDVGLPTQSVIKNQFRHYTCIRDIAMEVVYFLNVEENYGEEVCEELINALVGMPAHALKLLSYMVIDLWSETQIEFKRRKISNRRRFGGLSNAVRKAVKEYGDKHPNLTYGEVLAVLEKEYSVLKSGAKAGASLADTLKRRTPRPRA